MKVRYERDEGTGVALRYFDWPAPSPEARKLVCVPYSGSTSTVFRPLATALGPMWHVIGVDPPGHGLGAPELPLTSVPDLARVIANQLRDRSLTDGFLLGYSVGGYVAHAMVEAWQATNQPGPRGLILCGVTPPESRDRHPVYSALGDDDLLDALERLGGLPPAIREERSIFDMFKHVVRAGFSAYESAPAPQRAIDTPVLLIGGRQDSLARPEFLDQWRQYCRTVHIELIDGPHIFLPDRRAEVAALIGEFASRLAPSEE